MMTEHSIAGIEKALEAGGGTHTVGDVVRQILAGDAQLWEDEDALIVTEINVYPRKALVHFWLATGELDAVVRLSHRVLEWATDTMGCDGATLSGRKGWVKALKGEGWNEMVTVMERPLGPGGIGQ